jgi:hypothetical protein
VDPQRPTYSTAIASRRARLSFTAGRRAAQLVGNGRHARSIATESSAARPSRRNAPAPKEEAATCYAVVLHGLRRCLP